MSNLKLTEREENLVIEAHTADELLNNVLKIIGERLVYPDGIEYGE